LHKRLLKHKEENNMTTKRQSSNNHHFPGVILDPVYSGKAYYTLLEEMKQHEEQWKGRKVLFLHTGGLFGMYDKISQLQPMLEKLDKADRMKVSL
jgi:1-aminocyclopropane-1-carboxylate deaminase/D-cysteine desulfhydrase-like pyridoxal-dependent ACC family enzyme